jgi:hypothetical protein
MTSALKKQLDEIRALAPMLNSAIDEANKIVGEVEKVLVHEAKVGVSATSGWFRSEVRRITDESTDETTDEEVRYYLGFGRVMGVYCVYIDETTYQKDNYGFFNEEVDSSKKAWSCYDRETRLESFQKLPELIDNIVTAAKELAESAKKTAAQVKAMVNDDDDTAPSTEQPKPFGFDAVRPVGSPASVGRDAYREAVSKIPRVRMVSGTPGLEIPVVNKKLDDLIVPQAQFDAQLDAMLEASSKEHAELLAQPEVQEPPIKAARTRKRSTKK